MKVTASAATTSGGPWLTVTPTSGTVPGNFSVTVNPVNLAAGTYNGEVDVTTTGTPLRVPVTLNVSASAGPACGYSISPVTESYPASGGAGTIGVTTTSACSWTAVSSMPWITVTSGLSGSGQEPWVTALHKTRRTVSRRDDHGGRPSVRGHPEWHGAYLSFLPPTHSHFGLPKAPPKSKAGSSPCSRAPAQASRLVLRVVRG